MQASTEYRGAGRATAGSRFPAVASVFAPRQHRAKALWAQLVASTWVRPLAKIAGLLALVAMLSWIGSRGGLFGLRVPSPAVASDAAGGTATTAPSQQVTDGAAPSGAEGEASVATATKGILSDGRIVLNQATEEQLQKLPKVGASRAHAIVELRKRMGRFRSVRDLLRVKGIGPRSLQKIQAMTVLDAPADAGTDS